MPLFDSLKSISNVIETALSIKLSQKDFDKGRAELLHVYLHETCRAAIVHCLPWINDLQDTEYNAIDEVMVHFLESEISSSLGLSIHSDPVFLVRLKRDAVFLDQVNFEHLKAVWQAYFWQKRDLEGMASYVLTILRHGRVIYHILPQEDWRIAIKNGRYAPSSLDIEGFIHCSEIDQVLASARAYFSGVQDLYLLCIALQNVRHQVRYENATKGDRKGFPHIYGPLNLEAVVNVSALVTDVHGDFVLPRYPQALSAWKGTV